MTLRRMADLQGQAAVEDFAALDARHVPKVLALARGVGTGLVVMALLVARNAWVFTQTVVESGDEAANSLLVEQARHFDLLVGNYSRVGFFHPGPVFLYVQAAGESVFYWWWGLVPSPYNGQLLAILALNAGLLGAAAAVLARSWPVGPWLAGVAVLLVGLTAGPNLLASTWMPFVYVAPFVALVVAAVSVAGGELRDVPLLVLAAGLLVHGHVAFVFFVAVVLAWVAVSLWPRRADLALGTARIPLAVAGVLVAAFAAPLVLNVVLNWPGEWLKYLTYTAGNASTGILGRTLGGAAFVVHYWRTALPGGLLPVLAATAVAGWAALRGRDPRERAYLRRMLALAAILTAALWFYAAVGVDDLGATYVGLFYLAVPLWVATLAVMHLAHRLGQVRPRAALAAAIVLALLAAGQLARTPGVRAPRPDDAVVRKTWAAIAAAGQPGLPVALSYAPELWPVTTGLLLAGDRAGRRVCLVDGRAAVMVTTTYRCAPQELSVARRVTLSRQAPATGTVLLGPLPFWYPQASGELFVGEG